MRYSAQTSFAGNRQKRREQEVNRKEGKVVEWRSFEWRSYEQQEEKQEIAHQEQKGQSKHQAVSSSTSTASSNTSTASSSISGSTRCRVATRNVVETETMMETNVMETIKEMTNVNEDSKDTKKRPEKSPESRVISGPESRVISGPNLNLLVSLSPEQTLPSQRKRGGSGSGRKIPWIDSRPSLCQQLIDRGFKYKPWFKENFGNKGDDLLLKNATPQILSRLEKDLERAEKNLGHKIANFEQFLPSVNPRCFLTMLEYIWPPEVCASKPPLLTIYTRNTKEPTRPMNHRNVEHFLTDHLDWPAHGMALRQHSRAFMIFLAFAIWIVFCEGKLWWVRWWKEQIRRKQVYEVQLFSCEREVVSLWEPVVSDIFWFGPIGTKPVLFIPMTDDFKADWEAECAKKKFNSLPEITMATTDLANQEAELAQLLASMGSEARIEFETKKNHDEIETHKERTEHEGHRSSTEHEGRSTQDQEQKGDENAIDDDASEPFTFGFADSFEDNFPLEYPPGDISSCSALQPYPTAPSSSYPVVPSSPCSSISTHPTSPPTSHLDISETTRLMLFGLAQRTCATLQPALLVEKLNNFDQKCFFVCNEDLDSELHDVSNYTLNDQGFPIWTGRTRKIPSPNPCRNEQQHVMPALCNVYHQRLMYSMFQMPKK